MAKKRLMQLMYSPYNYILLLTQAHDVIQRWQSLGTILSFEINAYEILKIKPKTYTAQPAVQEVVARTFTISSPVENCYSLQLVDIQT